jgi:hypothetical protein
MNNKAAEDKAGDELPFVPTAHHQHAVAASPEIQQGVRIDWS